MIHQPFCIKGALKRLNIGFALALFGVSLNVFAMEGGSEGGWRLGVVSSSPSPIVTEGGIGNVNGSHPLRVVERSSGNHSEQLVVRAVRPGVHHDPGFANTAECKSQITYIDGEAGILLYRGYAIEDLASNAHFLEVAYLLIYGQLPTEAQLDAFMGGILGVGPVPEALSGMLSSFKPNADPMKMLIALLLALESHLEVTEVDQDVLWLQLLGNMPSLAAMAYHRMQGTDMPEVINPSSVYVGLFLQRLLGQEFSPEVVKALDSIFLLHADHEQNCSTSTLRMIGSSKADVFMSIAGAIGALSGPLHGGANQEVIDMLEKLAAQVTLEKPIETVVAEFIAAVKNKERLLMGFGHRVYKNYDPRAKQLQSILPAFLEGLGQPEDPLLKIALLLERVALADEYFTERKLYPNIDFYSGLCFKALGINPRFYPVLFAVGRLPGWLAHYREQSQDPERRVCRPQQIYVGEDFRVFVHSQDAVPKDVPAEELIEELIEEDAQQVSKLEPLKALL